jgi:signal transduction histidine kinase
MYYGVAMLLFIVLALSAAGIHGALKFRKLTKDIRARAYELPLVAQINQEVSDLRVIFSQIHQPCDFPLNTAIKDESYWSVEFIFALNQVSRALDDYEHQLEMAQQESASVLSDNSNERKSVCKMRDLLGWLEEQTRGNWIHDRALHEEIEDRLAAYQELVSELPAHMKQRMESFADSSRSEYHTWITISALMSAGAAVLLLLLMRRFHQRVFHPLETLVQGSRRVARGDYDHRIRVGTDDEVAELAQALNAMTANFQDIKLDLNRQVQQRTAEVVRSEKMASVGFLAAGVAHEINNPLASIAWSAESLEMRICDILDPKSNIDSQSRQAEIADLKKYLKRIQDEAFRCKGITSGLLNFSRLGEARKAPADLLPLIEGVVEMIKPLSRYRDKEIVLRCKRPLLAVVNEQEIKQVVLNLVTNALDSLDRGGRVAIELGTIGDMAQLVVSDTGCGMTADVMENIFEPFFTRKREGQGTGLGLSITYRIIEEHGGSIVPQSAGPGLGSTFTVTLPLAHDEQEIARAA